MKQGFLSGYKTYVLAVVAVVGAFAAYALGEMTLQQAIEASWAGGVAATLRHGIKSSS